MSISIKLIPDLIDQKYIPPKRATIERNIFDNIFNLKMLNIILVVASIFLLTIPFTLLWINYNNREIERQASQLLIIAKTQVARDLNASYFYKMDQAFISIFQTENFGGLTVDNPEKKVDEIDKHIWEMGKLSLLERAHALLFFSQAGAAPIMEYYAKNDAKNSIFPIGGKDVAYEIDTLKNEVHVYFHANQFKAGSEILNESRTDQLTYQYKRNTYSIRQITSFPSYPTSNIPVWKTDLSSSQRVASS